MNNKKEKNDLKRDIEESLQMLETYEPKLISEKKDIIKNFPANLRVRIFAFWSHHSNPFAWIVELLVVGQKDQWTEVGLQEKEL